VDESIDMIRQGVELDPLESMANTWLACAYFYGHRHEESIRAYERLLALDPNWLWSKIYLSHNYSMLGEHEKALTYVDQVEAVAQAMGETYVLTYVGGDYAWAGKEEKAREILANAIDLHGKGSMDAVSVAVIFAQLGEKEQAFEWLNRAIDERAGIAVWLKIYGGTFLRDLKPDPRFDDILRRVGFQV
jgi:tetratricopeptide (TPR) repeat protein